MIRPFLFALRGIRAYWGRSLLAALGIAMASFLVITLLAVLFNFKISLLGQFNGEGARQIIAVPGKLVNKQAITSGVSDLTSFKPAASTLTAKDVEDVKARVSAVSKAAPQSETVTVLKQEKKSMEALWTGTTPDLIEILGMKVQEGTFLGKQHSKPVVVLGASVKKELFGEGKAVGKHVTIQGKTYEIVGVLAPKSMFGFNIDDRVYSPYNVVENETKIKEASFLFFQAKTTDLVPLAEQQIDRVLLKNHGKKDFNLLKADEAIHLVETIMKLLTAITVSITGVALLVGGVGIMNVMLLTVKERTREIGIRKAVGARSWQILLQFLYESILLSVLGTGIGLAASYGALYGIHTLFPILSPAIPESIVLYTIWFAVGSGLVFGIIPALRALRTEPIEALRYE